MLTYNEQMFLLYYTSDNYVAGASGSYIAWSSGITVGIPDLPTYRTHPNSISLSISAVPNKTEIESNVRNTTETHDTLSLLLVFENADENITFLRGNTITDYLAANATSGASFPSNPWNWTDVTSQVVEWSNDAVLEPPVMTWNSSTSISTTCFARTEGGDGFTRVDSLINGTFLGGIF